MRLNALIGKGLALAIFSTASLAPAASFAQQAFPSKPLQMIVPYAAGGSTDLAGRIVAKGMNDKLGQPVVVDNRAGAAGVIGVSQALRSAPDGYISALSGVSTTMLHELLGRKLPYDPKKDINAVGYLGSSSMAIITRPNSPFKTLANVLEQSRKEPGSITFGTAGNASPGHLAAEYLANMAKVKMTHVPYTGDSATLNDLISGRVDIAVVGIASVSAQIKAGSLKALALTSGARLSTLPDVPTVAETGLTGYAAEIWNLLVLPKGTPTAVDQKLNQTVNALIVEPAVRDALLQLGMTAQPMSLPEIQRFVQTEREKWAKVIRDANIRID